MSDLKIIADPEPSEGTDPTRAKLPVPVNDGALNRRDLDVIKRDLITVRKDYAEIRDNMTILTHQYSSAPSRSFFISFGVIWLALLALLLSFQVQLTEAAGHLMAMIIHR